jgi:DNA-directed RNA polymerase specialized sigma24 family protein
MDESSAQLAQASDAELIAASASGDPAAFDVLRERHAAAAENLASLLAVDPAAVQEIVSETFSRARDVLRSGHGPRAALRPYLFTAVRWAAHRHRAGQSGQSTLPLAEADAQEPLFTAPDIADLVRSPLNQAFMSLPELWRAVLWHSAVEQASPALTAEVLGLDGQGLAELAAEASAGLRQAYQSQHLSGGAGDLPDPGPALRRFVAPIFLGSAAAGYLSAAEMKIGGLRWVRPGADGSARKRRPRHLLAAGSALLVAVAGTGLALALAAAAAPQRAAAQQPAAAPAVPSSQAPGSPPPAPGPPARPRSSPARSSGSGSRATPPRTGRPAPAPSPAPSPHPSAPSPAPSPTFPSPSPPPTPPPGHHRHHHPPAT